MKVIVNTDNNIVLSANATEELEARVETTLANVGSHLTRVEIHVSDQSAGRSTGKDHRCLVEARPEGQEPLFATDDASTMDAAVNGALRKMIHVLETDSGRRDHHKGASSMGGIEPS